MPTTILFLHRGGDQLRGTEEALLTLLDGLDRARWRPVVVASHPVLRAPLAERGVPCHVLDFAEVYLSRGERRLPLRGWWRAALSVVAIAREHGAGLLFSNGGGPAQLGVPVARRLGVPHACLFHHPAPRNYLRFWLLRHVDAMLFASEFTRQVTSASLGRSGDVVHIGIDVERWSPPAEREPAWRARYGYGPEHVVFAQVGALVPHKGHDVLLDAFARLRADVPEARLLVVGGGPQRAHLEARAAALGIAGVATFTGYVDDIACHFRHVMDVNVLASREEGLGLVNLQASACGLPNVATDGTGIRETMVHGETGFLFPQDDAAALAGHMAALARDPGLRARLGAAGRALVLREFSKATYCARMDRALGALVAARPAARAAGRAEVRA